MRHAVIDNDTIVNIIEIDPRNASDFGNAVTIPEGVGAGVTLCMVTFSGVSNVAQITSNASFLAPCGTISPDKR